MKINSKVMFLLCFLMVITFVSSSETIGQRQDAQVETPYIISQPCASCSYINITILNKDGIIAQNVAMTNNGSTWVYNFTPNSSLRHDVNGVGDMNGIDDSFAFWFDVTLSGERSNPTIILSDIILLLGVIGIALLISAKHQKVDFSSWDKNLTSGDKNMGQIFIQGFIYNLFKHTFIWLYFLGWIMVLILRDVVYRFNSAVIYEYFTLIANIYSLGLLLVLIFMIGTFASYMRNSISTLADNNWGVGDGE